METNHQTISARHLLQSTHYYLIHIPLDLVVVVPVGGHIIDKVQQGLGEVLECVGGQRVGRTLQREGGGVTIFRKYSEIRKVYNANDKI